MIMTNSDAIFEQAALSKVCRIEMPALGNSAILIGIENSADMYGFFLNGLIAKILI